MKTRFIRENFYSVPRQELFEFHERDDAFRLLTPEFANVEVETTVSTLAPSDEVARFAVRFGPLRFKAEHIHTVYEPFELFVDEQKKGLFSQWRHEHRFLEGGWVGNPASMLSDEIVYGHPLLPFINPFVRNTLRKVFAFRHRVTAEEVHRQPGPSTGLSGKPVIVTGATGLIGSRIVQILREQGVDVIAFARDVKGARKRLGEDVSCVFWDFTRPDEGDWRDYLSEADGVIHLAGTPLFQKRWNAAFKREMEESRVLGTQQLVDAIIQSRSRPRAFVSASALGFYGTDLDRDADEDAPPGNDLLAQLCVNWEGEASRLDAEGVRSVLMRVGIVLTTESGALKELLPLFRLGVGGVMGDPDPYINWIHVEDIARMFIMALENEQMSGPYNAAGPNPVTNGDFARGIARALRRPALLRFPVSLVKVIIGEAAEYASGGPRVKVDRIRDAGYRFFFEDLGEALNHLLR